MAVVAEEVADGRWTIEWTFRTGYFPAVADAVAVASPVLTLMMTLLMEAAVAVEAVERKSPVDLSTKDQQRHL